LGLSIRTDSRHFVSIILFFSLLLSAACSSQDRVEGFIHYRLNYNPTTLDPAQIVDVTGGLIAAKLFNGLVRLDQHLAVVPDIAEWWEISPDGTTYIFHFKKGIKFFNNREVIADDFKYSFERILDPKGKSPNAWVFEKIVGAKAYMRGAASEVAGITVIDSHTLRIALDKPFSPFLNLLTMTAAYVVPKEEVERLGHEFSTYPMGTGPFMLREWRHNDRLLLERNDHYFAGKAQVKGISYRIIPEDLTAVTEFELGNLDIISIPASEFQRFKDSEKWKNLIASQGGVNTYYLGFNCAKPPFDDPFARKAISHAIDRKKILETYYEKRGVLAYGPIPEALRAWYPPQPLSYDPETAKKLIERSGLSGHTIRFYVPADQEVADIAEIIQYYLKNAGLSVSIRPLEWSSYKAALNKGEADMFWISWWADYPDPENFLFPLFHSSNHGPSGNRTWYTNEAVDALIEKGQRLTDTTERNRYYGKAEQIIVDDAPWVFFWHKADFTLRQPSVKNYTMRPIYSIDKGLEVSF
jgi:peptide/nickel transport system substrate-binding protein/oligopeptide transport system substrate-binding protein